MKILAIRGCNLASLAGEFEIDLATGALGGAGVFAIVGPTGAGKSTLLDAMCVALFDRTPRLTNRSTVIVGRGDDDPTALGAQDVRTLLRRGATAGWAEVDFESGDLRKYRARWSVRRARGATDGRFQDQQVSLVAIDGGERLGGTKTETLKAIHERLGLSFEQFRRSALLAQGEFAAFLRADGKDRSELLERMTGTQIYSRLSIAAHLKATHAEQQLRDRHAAAMAISVLADDARADAEAALVVAKTTQQAARARLAAADAAARWLAEAARRDHALAEAELSRQQMAVAVDAAAFDRAELALRRRAETLRPAWDDAARIDRQLAIVRAELVVASDATTQAVGSHAELKARRARVAELHVPIREARLAAGLVEQPPTAVANIEARALAAGDDATWLLARRGLAPEIAAWPELDAKLARQRAVAEEINAADRALADHARKRAERTSRRSVIVGARDVVAAALLEAERDAAKFHERRGLGLDAAGRQEDAARVRCAEIDRLIAIAASARSAAATRAELEVELAALEARVAHDAEHRIAVTAERDTAGTLRDERARVLVELRRAAGYEHARTELVAGEPCPLCGAADHPWRDRGAFDALIGDAEAALAIAVQRNDAAIAVLAQLEARARQHGVERSRLASTRDSAETTADAAIRAWREHLGALGELMLVVDPASADAARLAAERHELAREQLEAARADRSRAEAVSKAIADAQARAQARHADLEFHATMLRELDADVAALDAAVERLRGDRGSRAERRAELDAELTAAFARWTAAVPEPLASRDSLAELAAAWRLRAATIATIDGGLVVAIAELDHDVRAAERAVVERSARREAAARRCDALAIELADAAQRLDSARAVAGFDAEELRRLLIAEPARLTELAEQLDAIDRAADRARTLVAERRRLVEDHVATRPAGIDPSDAAQLDALGVAVASADRDVATWVASLAVDVDARARRAAALAEYAVAEHAAEIDRVLGQLIGSHDGKLFRSFAQSLTLDGLLAVANAHLEELAPRYQLERVPKHDLELQVIDRDLGSEIRSVQTLSGGESFLVSLALALGLSSMSAHDVRVRTLLIDEGFGTLDPATLDSALSVLDALQATGRQVGVISHVPALVERVGAHIRIAPRGGGRSEVIVPS